jgi:hypothetical protein
LQPRVHLADLVEQERAAVGLFELAQSAGDGAGEGALLVAEQLRFEQVVGNRRAVEGDEAVVGATERAISSLPVPDSPVMSTEASLGAIWSARRSTAAIAGSRLTIAWFCSATASSTAAMSCASGGRGMYSLAPARMARTAALASVPMPQATTGTLMRSVRRLSISRATSSFTSIITRSAPWPARRAAIAPSMLSVCATLAPRDIAIFPAAAM